MALPAIKDSKCVIPAILGRANPTARMTNMYMALVLVGMRVKLIPIIANTTPDAPIVGIDEVYMKDAATETKYRIGMSVRLENTLLFRHMKMAYRLHIKCSKLP